ncbi:MAG TPA: O-antigen ligase family protein [Candidatus Acidoferrales bacterium]|nr:O-antigen ligase family protein [Candidatus Acidoferrales bacterium]
MKTLRLGIIVLLAFGVLAFGAVEVWSETLLEVGAAFLSLWWAVLIFRHRDLEIHWNIIFWPLIAFLGLVVVQLSFGLTAYSFLTRVALLKIAACFVLFFLSCQAFRGRRDLRALTWFLMGFAFAISVFGIVQNFTSHDVLYWVRPLTGGGSPFGPYVNRNDFAGLMEMLAPFGLSVMLFQGVRREQLPFAGILTVVPIAALVLTGSRGGITSFAFEVVLLILLMRLRNVQKLQAPILASILLAAIVLLGWIGVSKVLDRFSSPSLSDLSADRRITMLRGTWRIFLDHPILGTGLGTLVDVYPRYETYYDGRIVDHAHDDYAELLAETGVAGGLCGLAFFLIFFQEARKSFLTDKSSFSLAIHAAACTGCAGMIIHSIIDFNLHIPANGFVFLLLTAIAVSPALPRRKPAPQS